MFNLGKFSQYSQIRNSENEPIGTEKITDSSSGDWEYDIPNENIEHGKELTVNNIADVIREKYSDLVEKLQGNRNITSEEIPSIAKEFSDYMISNLLIEKSEDLEFVLDILDGGSLFDLAKIISRNDGYGDDISALLIEQNITKSIENELQLNFS